MNSTLFLKVFNSSVLNRLIFNKVRELSRGKRSFKWHEILVLPDVLAGNNYLQLLKDCLDKSGGVDIDSELYINAIRGGNLEIFKYLLDYFSVNPPRQSLFREIKVEQFKFYKINLDAMLINSALGGRTDIITYLLNTFKSYRFDYYRALSASAYSGNFELLKFFVGKCKENKIEASNYDVRENVFNQCAYLGRLDMIGYLVTNYPHNMVKSDMISYAIESGQIDVVIYLLQNKKIFKLTYQTESLLDQAAYYNRFEIAQFLLRYGHGKCTAAMDNAAYNGNLEFLKWIHSNTRGSRCSAQAFYHAVTNSNYEMVRWLHENTTERCSKDTSDYAAGQGDIRIVKYIHEKKIGEFSNLAMENAARFGHLDILQFLHDNKYSCSKKAMDNAIITNRLEIVQFLHEHRIEGCSESMLSHVFSYDLITKKPKTEDILLQWLLCNRPEFILSESNIDTYLSKLFTIDDFKRVELLLNCIRPDIISKEKLVQLQKKYNLIYPNSNQSNLILYQYLKNNTSSQYFCNIM
ncbi:hypothetical protein PPL_07704 [Heterostelium album PN500]|uniref:Ankyrin repeat protein n=1 Tax=Heterostelium pallidum (strain ATCC 26659 / Pp 5 / PN500) TaxID=670386 RepID=D3BGQ2_HETP5|nr:hypothetical protein PPL_07704 [Heterostelium album PN500]EFA79286.1 hypothetical protein PPL_07704 [Heterostelium album PN500]|eukprot:XP_020431407.1 hypothetical protein PPL_07704 [Heterostelium album PN500]